MAAAKGLAHLGAWRAIQELGIQIDAVAGVSFGALMGAGVALDYAAKELYQEVEDRLVTGSRGLADLTFRGWPYCEGRRSASDSRTWPRAGASSRPGATSCAPRVT